MVWNELWPMAAVVLNLILLESLLSVDNAAVLAVMVKDLPSHQKNKALRYGLLGAYVFRFLCLIFASYLVNLEYLKGIGGMYLIYLAYKHFFKGDDGDGVPEWAQPIYNFFIRKLGVFWTTIIVVEMMDLTFSIDNIFAAVAMTDVIWMIMLGVGIGMLAMRFVAGKFVALMEEHPKLANSAFVVIAILGLKLLFSELAMHFSSLQPIEYVMQMHWFDLAFSGLCVLIFAWPLVIDGIQKRRSA